MCTSLGAALAFVVPLENKRFLAISLALSAGVMVYVSMVEIFVKALTALSDEWCPDRTAGDVCPRGYGATTGLFFAGVCLTAGLNVLTSRKTLARCFPNQFGEDKEGNPSCAASTTDTAPEGRNSIQMEELPAEGSREGGGPWPEDELELPEGWRVVLSKSTGKHFFQHVETGNVTWESPVPLEVQDSLAPLPVRRMDSGVERFDGIVGGTSESELELGSVASSKALKARDAEVKKLNATGLLTGLAIAVHNFPEGLATFVGAMADPSLGAAIAVAISIHNIPEGVCVAMPIYYATGSRLRAFMWATLSGVSEPIGALFGYAVLGGEINLVSYGVMFGLVAGMMVYISLAELLPAAYRYDTNPVVPTVAMVSGMVLMALSLVAFAV